MLTGTPDIASDDEPLPFVIFFSNGSGTDIDETDSQKDTASKGKVDTNVMDSKAHTASEGEV